MKQKFSVSLTLALIMAMLVTSLALADNVQNDVTAGGNDTFTLGGSTVISYRIAANNGDGQSGCNASDGSPAIVTINTPSGVTASPNPLSFSACSTYLPTTFTATTPGNYLITVSVSDPGTGSYNTTPATFTLHVLAPSDSTPPVINPTVIGTLGDNGWYVSDVDVSWTITDAESNVTNTSGCGLTTIDYDTAGVTLTCSATSAGGTSSASVTIKRDATLPTLAPTVSPNPVFLNGSATASPNASDNLSGVASSGCDSVNTSSVGSHSVNCTATDYAGNSNSASASYSVIYNWNGFFQPIDNNMLNVAKGGSGIPVKFSLSGNQGLGIFAVGYPRSVKISCDFSLSTDEIETTVTAGGSSLSYDTLADQYVYVWKTEKSWANSCRQLQVMLNDGTTHTANFKFK